MKLDLRSPMFVMLAALCALAAFALTGCASTASGPRIANGLFESQPDTLEYPGPPHFWNKAGLVISPARILAQVGTEVPMFAAVCDDKGQLQAHEAIEWSLDHSGVGSFASVAEADRPIILELLSSKPRKVDSTYAITETLPDNVILTRGTPQINDDIVMPRGYTWVTVSSPKEGISFVTAMAPDVYSWEARQKSATIHWIDAEWSFPEPVCATPGKPAMLCTCVVRHTTKAAVSDWIVKYTITGGAAAGLGAENGKSVEIATDSEGRACVEVIPVGAANGTTCVSVELIRAECAAQGEGERMSIASSATQVTWAIPDAVTTTPPATLAPPTATTVTPAPGPQPLSQPPPRTFAPQPSQPPTQPQAPAVPAAPAAAPRIELSVTGPVTAKLGEDVTFGVEVVNRGNAPATGLVITDRFDSGLRHGAKNDPSPIQRGLDSPGGIAPGTSRKIDVQFRVAAPGKLCHTVEIRGPSGVLDSKTVCLDVAAEPPPPAQPAMEAHITVPQRVYSVGELPVFTVEVRNKDTSTSARNVKVDVTFEQGLIPKRARPVPQRISSGVEFVIDTLAPGAAQAFDVECECVAVVSRACAMVSSPDASQSRFADQTCIAIQPPQAQPGVQSNLRVSVSARSNPVRVGNEVAIQVTISNAGTNPEDQVKLSVKFPDSLQLSATPNTPTAVVANEAPYIRFAPVGTLRAGEPVSYVLFFRTLRPGTAEIQAEVTGLNQRQPLTRSQAVTINP